MELEEIKENLNLIKKDPKLKQNYYLFALDEFDHSGHTVKDIILTDTSLKFILNNCHDNYKSTFEREFELTNILYFGYGDWGNDILVYRNDYT
jgi:hypothetical protein